MTIAIVLLGYLFGSIPFAWLLARRVGGVDVRRVGSGNVGATNVLRSSGSGAAITTALLDITKGAAAVLLARGLGATGGVPAAAGVAAIFGHVYPLWLAFRGGKGVATTCGVFAVLAPVATAIAVGLFVLTVRVTRIVSAGSLVAAASLAPLAYLTHQSLATGTAAVVAGIGITLRHSANLIRLLDGTEPRLGARNDP